jgi:hypothetical protein
MHRRLFPRAADNRDRLFDGRPQTVDLAGRAGIGLVTLHVFVAGQRQREACPMRDLAAPHRDLPALARHPHGRRFQMLTFGRSRVENDGVGRARLPRERDGFLHGVDIKQTRPARNNDKRGRFDGFDDACRTLRRRVDQDPFDAFLLGLFDNLADAALHDLERQASLAA